MDFAAWLQEWLSRHPLKSPQRPDPGYTAEVMARVHALGRPSPQRAAVRAWTPWPRLALALTAVATLLVVLVPPQRATAPLAEGLRAEALLLAELGEPVAAAEGGELALLAAEVDEMELLVLAEAPPSDAAWIAEMLELMDEIEESLPAATSGEPTNEDWLDELRLLDEQEFATRS